MITRTRAARFCNRLRRHSTASSTQIQYPAVYLGPTRPAQIAFGGALQPCRR